MVKQQQRPRATGRHGNGAQPLQTDSLLACGLSLVVHLTASGKVESQAVIPTDEVPESWFTARPRPPRPCGACNNDRWRLDRLGIDWVCGRCHP